MATDEELERHVRQVEQEYAESPELAHRLDSLESTARCVHNELARRIEATAADSADADSLVSLEKRLSDIERRLSALESHVES
jgi:tetrahydromethanopterin S-methyltransferase subunit G